jgi:Putative prokaryotic signal transducing protein
MPGDHAAAPSLRGTVPPFRVEALSYERHPQRWFRTVHAVASLLSGLISRIGDYEMNNRLIGWEPEAGRGYPDAAPGSDMRASPLPLSRLSADPVVWGGWAADPILLGSAAHPPHSGALRLYPRDLMTRLESEQVVTVAGTSQGDADEVPNVPVAVVGSRIEADLIVGMLHSNGVRAVVAADDAGGLEPQLQVEGVRVLVTPSDEAPARRLLAEAAAGDEGDGDG